LYSVLFPEVVLSLEVEVSDASCSECTLISPLFFNENRELSSPSGSGAPDPPFAKRVPLRGEGKAPRLPLRAFCHAFLPELSFHVKSRSA